MAKRKKLAGPNVKRNVPHRSLRESCKWCGKKHSSSQHAAHGEGSMRRTHPGMFKTKKRRLKTSFGRRLMAGLGIGDAYYPGSRSRG